MFCPTAIDEFFEKKFSQLDINFNKKTQLTYRDRVSFEDRVKEAEDTRSRYPNKVPLVIERHKSEKYLPAIDKVNIRLRDHLFLAPSGSQGVTLSVCLSDTMFYQGLSSLSKV